MIRPLTCALLLALPLNIFGSVSTVIEWDPSTDITVAGYNVYYGTNSHAYTQMISAGEVTNITIGNLLPGTTYYFSVKSHDAAGNEGAFSAETSFTAFTVMAGDLGWRWNTMPASLTNDQLTFSLGAGAPAGAMLNPNNGMLSWVPGFASADSTNNFNIIITDLSNPSASTQATIIVTVSDFLVLTMASVPVQTGQFGSIPLNANASDGITNLTLNMNWPGNALLNPTLTFSAPIAGGTLQNQGTNLMIQLWTANGEVLTQTNAFAQINFQAAADQPSAFIPLVISNANANKTDGSVFANVTAQAGEVVVIGANPLLRPQFIAGQGRVLSFYANPGTNYLVQSTTNLIPPVAWQSVQTFQPTNQLQTVNLDSADPVIFYRLMQQ